MKAKFIKCYFNQLLEISVIFIFACAFSEFVFLEFVWEIPFIVILLYLLPDIFWIHKYNSILKKGEMLTGKVVYVQTKRGQSPLAYCTIGVEIQMDGYSNELEEKTKIYVSNKKIDRGMMNYSSDDGLDVSCKVYWIDHDNYAIIMESVGLPDIYH